MNLTRDREVVVLLATLTCMSISGEPTSWRLGGSLLAATIPIIYLLHKMRRISARASVVRNEEERVLILGASSGVGRSVAKKYAARNARVCIVARRSGEISKLAEECGKRCLWIEADFTKVEDMIRVRERLQQGMPLCLCSGTLRLCLSPYRMEWDRYPACLCRSVGLAAYNGFDRSEIS